MSRRVRLASSGLEVVYVASGGGPATVKSSEAFCPEGKKVSGGGHLIIGDERTPRVTVSTPGQVPNPTSWYVEAKEPSATGPAVDAVRLCRLLDRRLAHT